MFSNYQRLLTNFGALLTWFAILAQLILALQTSTEPTVDTLFRFFSSFSILSNIAVALYFTSLLFHKSRLYRFFARDGHSTAVVIYILLGSLIYQVLLRSIWHTEGVQKIVDELLHSLIPIFVLQYWFLFADKKTLHLKQIPNWSSYLIYYVCYITLRGAITGVYPYPFIDVTLLGYPRALLHTLAIFLSFVGLSAVFMFIAKRFVYS